jgi:hypothetical protein
MMERRNFLQYMTGLASFVWARNLLGQTTPAPFDPKKAERLIIVYHPDGAFLEQWHPAALSGSISSLSESLLPLAPYRDQLLLLRRLNLLDGSGDGHEDAARCLLSGSTNPAQGSLDVHLADQFKQPLLHVGVQASKNQGHSVSFLPGGSEKIADDSPLAVYQRLFQSSGLQNNAVDKTLLKSVEKELQSFLARTDVEREKNKLQQHLKQIQVLLNSSGTCSGYDLSTFAYDDGKKWDDKAAPVIMKMQMHNLVHAMECGLARVATLQFSRHTSTIKMDYDWLSRWNNEWPMESHQASHNSGAIHAQQKKWINQQLTMLFALLADRPEPRVGRSGSMLDHSLVLVVTEIAQGASHTRRDMPYYLVGGKGIAGYNPGRILDCNAAPHTQLLYSMAEVMGGRPSGAYASAGALKALFAV